MRQRVAEFAAFVNAAGGLRCDVAGNAAGKTELLEELLHSHFVLRDVRIELSIRAFQIGIGDDARPAMPRTDDVHHVELMFFDDAIEMDIDEVEAGRRAPVPEQAWLDVFLA